MYLDYVEQQVLLLHALEVESYSLISSICRVAAGALVKQV